MLFGDKLRVASSELSSKDKGRRKEIEKMANYTYNENDFGFNIRDARWVMENGAEATAAEIKKIVGDNKAYLTFERLKTMKCVILAVVVQ